MAAPAAGAAELPVLAYIAIGLLAAVMYVVALGLHGAWVRTFGVLFSAIGGVKVSLGLGRSVHPLGFVEDASNAVANGFLNIAKGSQHAMGYLFHGAAVIQGWIAREIVGLATDTLGWARWVQHVHLPRYVKWAIYAAFPPALLAKLIKAHALPRIIHEGRVVTHTVTHTIVHTVVRIMHATAGAVPLPGWVIHLPRRVGRLERDWTQIKARLRRLERAAGATGAVALFVAALAKLGLKWLRCRNVTKAGRAICRTDTSLLDSLLGDVLVIASAVSVVTFARELLAIEDEALIVAHKIIREFPDPRAVA